MILLSIITPAFNSSKWLNSCIENVACQNVGNEIEHLIIDGGSQDGSAEIIQKSAAEYSHLRWLSEPDTGQSNAMNKGLKLARGKWIGFLNADDFYEPGVLQSVLEIIKKNPGRHAFLIGNLNILNDFDSVISVCKPSSMSLPRMLADICAWPYNPSSYFYPSKLHQEIGYFDEEEHFAMDYDFIFRILLAKVPVEYYNQTWGNFRMQADAKTVTDQNANLSYSRSEMLRKMYYLKSCLQVRILSRVFILFWALRNKLLGFFRKIGFLKWKYQ